MVDYEIHESEMEVKIMKKGTGKGSASLKLNKTDLKKIAVGAAIAASGAVLTYATDIIPQIDWGVYKPVIVAIAAILVNAGWKILRSNK